MFTFQFLNDKKTNVPHPSATSVDGWRGEWIKLNFNHQRYLICHIDGWIDGDNPWAYEISLRQDFVCTIP